jgi:hypothetical protein
LDSSLLLNNLLVRNSYWHDNDHQENDDTNNYAHAHLHVLPPHLFPNPVGTTTEPLGGVRQVVSLVLKSVQSCTTICDLVDVLAHYTDSVIDLLLDGRSSLVPGTTGAAGGTAAGTTLVGNVWVVRCLRHLCVRERIRSEEWDQGEVRLRAMEGGSVGLSDGSGGGCAVLCCGGGR